MPVVPVPERNIQETGLPTSRVDTSAPIEAFGGGAGAEKVTSAASQVIDIAKKEKEKADDVATMDAYQKTIQLKNQLMYDPQKGAMTRKGKNAFGVIEDYVPQFEKATGEISEGLGNREQRLAYQKMVAQQGTEFRDSLQKHTFQESQNFAIETGNATVQTLQDDSALNYHNPDKVQANIEMMKRAREALGSHLGQGAEQTALEVKKDAGQTHNDIVSRMLGNNQNKEAIAYFDKVKTEFPDQLDKAHLENLEKKVEDARMIVRANDTWAEVSKMRLANGHPDDTRIQAYVDKKFQDNDDAKQYVRKYVRSMGNEVSTNMNKEADARFEAVLNEGYKAFEQHVPLEQAMGIIQRHGTTPAERATMTDTLNKIYEPSKDKSDTGTYLSAWERVQKNTAELPTVTVDDLDKMKEQHQLSVNDYKQLRKDLFKSQTESKDPLVQYQWSRVDTLAKEKFPGNKQAEDQFKYVVRVAAQGKGHEQIMAIANDKLKDDPTSGKFSFTQVSQYKTDIAKLDAQNDEIGRLYNEVGAKETRAVFSYLPKGPGPQGKADMDAFAARFGGYENIKAGTPVNNAIKSLMRDGQPVDAAHIERVLKFSATGEYHRGR